MELRPVIPGAVTRTSSKKPTIATTTGEDPYPYSINVRIDDIGMGKDGIDLSITRGVQYCRYSGERLTIVHKHSYLQDIEQGELVLFETRPRGQDRLFWVGRTTNTAYWFMFDTPQTIFEVIAWLSGQQDMLLAHNGDLDFVDMDRQGELPF